MIKRSPTPGLSRARQSRASSAAQGVQREMRRAGVPFSMLYAMTPLDRIAMVREGVPAQVIVGMAAALGIPKYTLYAVLGLARATMDRKVSRAATLNADEGERVLGIAQLVGQVQQMVLESATLPTAAKFDAARWVGAWLDAPLAALGGQRPADFMDTAEGRAIVSRLLALMQTGAYA